MNELVLVLFLWQAARWKVTLVHAKRQWRGTFHNVSDGGISTDQISRMLKGAINPLYRTASNPHSSKQGRDWLRVAGRVEVADAPAVALDPVAVHRHVRWNRCALQQRFAHLIWDAPGQQVLMQLQRLQIG
jgi:hypothetical protein